MGLDRSTLRLVRTLYLTHKPALVLSSVKLHNFPNCKLIQIIFGRNIADKLLNKVTHGNFGIC